MRVKKTRSSRSFFAVYQVQEKPGLKRPISYSPRLRKVTALCKFLNDLQGSDERTFSSLLLISSLVLPAHLVLLSMHIERYNCTIVLN